MSGAFTFNTSSSADFQTPTSTPVSSVKPPRIISCVLCQQRKVRCDRKTPCSNCIKARVECISATAAPRRRRRRFAERDLLDRLRKYEDLLRQHGIKFEPLHKESSLIDTNTPSVQEESASENEDGRRKGLNKSNLENGNDSQQNDSTGATTFWKAINQEFRDPERIGDSSDEENVESTIQNAWDQLYDNNDHIFFGSGMSPKNLVALHPDPARIFRIWQVYLDNVNPIFRITHAPTLQQQMIEASSNLLEVSLELEALMFGIYCAAIMSLPNEDCLNMFGEDRDTLNLRYQSGCQQALVNVGFLHTSDMRVLTALFLYLISIRQNMDPRSLSAMIGIALRIAQRLGLHAESSNKEVSPFEGEMRRRLWWQIVIFDSRMGELANYKASTLTPTWDCKLPLNINDSDLAPHIQKLPNSRDGPTESLFVMIQCQIAEFIRDAKFHLDFVSPFLSSLAKDYGSAQSLSIDDLEEMLRHRYLKDCDSQIPLQFLSSCTCGSLIGKWRLAEFLSKKASKQETHPVVYREKIFRCAIHMIELDTMLQTNSDVRGFQWFVNFQFPFPAYVYLVQELRRTTTGNLVEQAWDTMAQNFEVRKLADVLFRSPQFRSFSQLFVKAWTARQSALEDIGEVSVPPRFISVIRAMIAAGKQAGLIQPSPSPQDVTNISPPPGIYASMQGQMNTGVYSDSTPGNFGIDLTGLETDVDQFGFGQIDWSIMNNMMGANTVFPGDEFAGGSQMNSSSFGNWN